MASDGLLITRASHGRTLDVEERQRRYAITMVVRTVCFLLFLVVPGWWKVVALSAALILPMVAVVLANMQDRRPPPDILEDDDDGERPALPPGEVIPGSVEPE